MYRMKSLTILGDNIGAYTVVPWYPRKVLSSWKMATWRGGDNVSVVWWVKVVRGGR